MHGQHILQQKTFWQTWCSDKVSWPTYCTHCQLKMFSHYSGEKQRVPKIKLKNVKFQYLVETIRFLCYRFLLHTYIHTLHCVTNFTWENKSSSEFKIFQSRIIGGYIEFPFRLQCFMKFFKANLSYYGDHIWFPTTGSVQKVTFLLVTP